MIIVNDIEQGSPEWFTERAGRPSASNFSKIVTSKGVRTAEKGRKDYMIELACEAVTGQKTETYQSAHMTRGIEIEPEARALFELRAGLDVTEVGLVYKDEQKRYSCSPDGLLADCGLEIKCPMLKTHVGYLRDDKLPTAYIAQVQGSMLVTGHQSWWFMSYYPGTKPLIIKVDRDNDFCLALSNELDNFCNGLDEMKAEYLSLCNG